jgi:hypothetical protein
MLCRLSLVAFRSLSATTGSCAAATALVGEPQQHVQQMHVCGEDSLCMAVVSAATTRLLCAMLMQPHYYVQW